LVNNLNEGMAWGLLPVLYAAAGLELSVVGALVAVAPAVWAFGQLVTGALSDRIGRKPLIVLGQLSQALGLAVIAFGGSVPFWVTGSVLYGAGTAMACPTLIAAVGDVAHPVLRGAAVGVYGLWRDLGFAAGAILAGLVADLYSVPAAIVLVAVISAASGLDVLVRMWETLPRLAQGVRIARGT
jgi:MFS family permease